MTKFLVSLSFLLMISFAAHAQTQRKVSLIVKNCGISEGVCHTQHLFRYNFLNGKFVGSEEILTTKTDDLRFDTSDNFVHKNRYVITNWGDIVDLATGSVLHKSDGELVDIDGDNVFIKIVGEDSSGIFAFNLHTRKYTEVKSPSVYDFKGALSPDKTRVANYRYGKGIVVTNIATGKQTVIKKKFSVLLSPIASEFGTLPLLWLDNHRLLTQKQNGEIVLVELNGKTKHIVKIPVKNEPYTSPTIYRNVAGEIIYDFYDPYVIDVENGRYREHDSFTLGNEFHAKADDRVQSRLGSGQVYFYKNIEIGRSWSGDATTTTGYLAIKYGEIGSNLGYPAGIKVWNMYSREWIEFPIKRSPEIIGWIEE